MTRQGEATDKRGPLEEHSNRLAERRRRGMMHALSRESTKDYWPARGGFPLPEDPIELAGLHRTFFARVQRGVDPEDCDRWQSRVDAQGNPRFAWDCVTYCARAVAWALHASQSLPAAKAVRSRCGNRHCLNPAHLEVIEAQDSAEQRPRRRRTAGWNRPGFKLPKGKDLELLELLFRAKRGSACVPGECWIWRGSTAGRSLYGRDYGLLFWEGRPIRAHRLAWALHHRQDIPSGRIICHHCDNSRCVNPEHLYLGTDASNGRDRALHGRVARGTEHARGKLTEGKVREIRRRRAAGEGVKSLAVEFEVSITTISLVANRRTWKHVD